MYVCILHMGFPGDAYGKNPSARIIQETEVQSLSVGKIPWVGKGNLFQYSCLETTERSLEGFGPCSHRENQIQLSDYT